MSRNYFNKKRIAYADLPEDKKLRRRNAVARCLRRRRKLFKESGLCKDCGNPLNYEGSLVMCRTCCLKRSTAYRKWMKVAA